MSDDTIMLSVFVPAEGKTLEVRTPRGIKAAVLIKDLAEIINRRGGEFIPDASTVLCVRKSGEILNPDTFIDDIGLINGSELFLI